MIPRLLPAIAIIMIQSGCNTTPDSAPGSPPPAGASVSVPVPESFRLANGMSVWLLSSKQVPLVTLSLVIPGGSALDPKGKEGLAALTVDMLDEGAGKRGPLEIAGEIDYLGAELGVDVQKEHFEVTLESLRRNLDPALDIFADVILRPSFDPVEWERVKSLDLNELAQRAEEPREVAKIVSERVFYGDDHPYGHPVDGYESTAKAVSLDEVKSFYASSFRPEHAVLLVVGDITLDELRQHVEKRFGSWKAIGRAPKEATGPAPSGSSRLIIVDKPDAPQTEIRVLIPAPEAASPRIAPLSLSNTVLGGTFTSRLITNLRERNGFTYGASSIIPLRRKPSHLVAGSAVHSDKTGPALVEFCRELRAMETGKLEPSELTKSRATHRSRLVESLETQESTLRLYAINAALGQGPAERRAQYERLARATDGDIARECREVYQWSRATIVLVGDRKTIEQQLQGLRANPPLDLSGKPCVFPGAEVLGREGEKV